MNKLDEDLMQCIDCKKSVDSSKAWIRWTNNQWTATCIPCKSRIKKKKQNNQTNGI